MSITSRAVPMLSDRDALLSAIRANPEEDTPRLMFADWLDENGDPNRAEFIRLQCELAQLADDGSDSQAVYEFLRDRDFVTRPSADWPRIDGGIHRRIALATRNNDLVMQFGRDWLPKLPKRYHVAWDGFHRGFPYRVSLDRAKKLAEIAPRLRTATPGTTLDSSEFSPEFVGRVADAGLMGWVNGLILRGACGLGLRAWGHHPEARAVTSLRVTSYDSGNTEEVIAALADSDHWAGLRELDLSESYIEADVAETLFGIRHLRSLRRLRVGGYGGNGAWTAETLRVFAAASFDSLVTLQLNRCGMEDDATEVLAACPHLKTLRTLDLDANQIAGPGVTALLTSPHLVNVAFLGLHGNPGTRLDADRLAAASPGGLRMFHGHGCRFRVADVRALAHCPRLHTLWYLDLDANNLGTTAVRELIRGFQDFCPPIIWMTHNRIDDRGAELLAKWKASQALDVLHLRYNSITDAGIRAILASPYLANLEGLGVDTEDFELLDRLRRRFRHFDQRYS